MIFASVCLTLRRLGTDDELAAFEALEVVATLILTPNSQALSGLPLPIDSAY
jgi:hypothetical protein